jgi:putative hemin transport protein
VEEETTKGIRRSLQIFDRDGEAVHKVYLNEESDLNAYNAIVERFRSDDQSTALPVEPLDPAEGELPDAEIDFPGLYADWYALKDTHDFFGLLKRFKVSRMQALRNAPDDLAWKVPVSALRTTLETAVERENPIMIFVGSRGVIQIFTGSIKRVVPTPPWINILDPGFNLHLREDAIDSAWVVRKPTVDGNVTSLELFDRNGETIAILFGKRKPGIQESEVWREIVEGLERA